VTPQEIVEHAVRLRGYLEEKQAQLAAAYPRSRVGVAVQIAALQGRVDEVEKAATAAGRDE